MIHLDVMNQKAVNFSKSVVTTAELHTFFNWAALCTFVWCGLYSNPWMEWCQNVESDWFWTNGLNVSRKHSMKKIAQLPLKVPGPISQNEDFYSNDASSPKKSWFQISVKSVKRFGYKKILCIVQLPILYCLSLIMVTITMITSKRYIFQP